MCQSCEVVRVNGVVCHEIGCPDAWQDEVRECKECGSEFKPESKNQIFCSAGCWSMYSGIDEEYLEM
jgi:hypothetical protein